jgi:hypothetical protein
MRTDHAMLLALLVLPCMAHASTARVERWMPRGISSPQYESHAAFDPRNGDAYWVESDQGFSGWHLRMAHCGAGGWSAPATPGFAAAGLEADPWFARDGDTLYFISNRSTDGIVRKDLDIFRVRRGADGSWQRPERLPPPVNSTANEWFPRVARDGWMYLGSERPGGFGKNDIWRAREIDGVWQVENAGAAINTADHEYEAEVSPDGKRLILNTADRIYESRLVRGAWSQRRLLGPEINVNGSEIGALFSPSGHSLLFSRDLKGAESGEFFVWRLRGHETWPVPCPRS